MRIYIPGPPSADQQETAALLTERGYRVTTHKDLNIRWGHPRQVQRDQAYEMLLSDAVVITDELSWDDRHHVVRACRFMGVAVVEYDTLPMLAPGCGGVDHVLDGLDLAHPAERHVRTSPGQRVQAWTGHVSDWFNTRFGWFFTNGNKAHRPVPYQLDTKPMTTT